MRRPRCDFLAGLAALTLLLAPSLTYADSPAASSRAGAPSRATETEAETEAASLREQANAAMNSGRPADALHAYERVFELTHATAMLYNMARAQQALTNYPEAEDLLRRFKAEAPAAVLDKVKNIDTILEEVVARIHTLTIRVTVPGAEVRIGQRILGSTPFDKPLRPALSRCLACMSIRSISHLVAFD